MVGELGLLMHEHPITVWHRLVQTRNPSGLRTLLADEVVFYSPVVHTPQRGKALTSMYLSAAFEVFFNQNFRYVREIRGPSDALLEFETVVEGIEVNGVDLIKWSESGEIVEFKVMIRPLKAINVIHQKMASMLELIKKNREA
jgi:SnoaL-like domain